MSDIKNNSSKKIVFDRSLLFKGALFAIGAVLIAQLFNVQILKHDYYYAQALAEHVKKFEVPADRGAIYISNGYQRVPLVLNEKKYIVYADPKFIQDTEESASKLQSVIGGDKNNLKELLNSKLRYVVLAKRIPKDQADRIKQLGIKGVGLDEMSVRTYPQGQTAAHVLGFVNDDNKGQYGIEAYMNEELTGKPGMKNEITDVNGNPLAINNDISSSQNPVPGTDLELTIDLRLQKIVEEKLKSAIERTSSEKGSVVLIDPKNGQIKAMANYPTYNPADYTKVEDLSLFTNTAISAPWEPGSVMKPLTVSASLNSGSLTRGHSYFDSGSKKVGDTTVTNAINFGAQTMTVDDVLTKSLNTGAVHVYESLGGGELNEKARNTWYDYLTNHYNFDKNTGVELANEVHGYVKPPKDDGAGIDITYANSSFGQGITLTPIQLAATYSALANGVTYYKPTIIASKSENGEFKPTSPIVVNDKVMTKETSDQVKDILNKSLKANNKAADRPGYRLGSKSGTAQVSDGKGNYKADRYNGAYVGYLEGKKLEYVLVTRLDEPKTSGFASFQAGILWSEITNEIINSLAIEPI